MQVFDELQTLVFVSITHYYSGHNAPPEECGRASRRPLLTVWATIRRSGGRLSR